MSAIIDYVPLRFHDGPAVGDTWLQPLHSVVDVSGYTDAAIFIHVFDADFDGGNQVIFKVLTAPENRDDRYVEIQTAAVDPGYSLPYTHMLYLTSKGEAGDLTGFDRYLRMMVLLESGNSTASFDIRALLRRRR